MLATLVIGLREGLEAALIVGIVAAFLKRNGHRLTAMWWGVGTAIALSLAVGAGLWALETSLPQAAQEGLETVIGALAVVFVTGMIIWMGGHGRTMKRELESSAAEALSTGTARALAVMAFLAVLKEGFETSVFLLATFRAAVSPAVAGAGALLGILVSIAIGFGIYAGGVRLNLTRFFRVTGAFLVLVAAGLTLTAVRTAHEAGWLNGGQQRTVDLSWLAPNGSIQASLVTGVLGIPADPRLIEVVAWFAYLIPVAMVVFLPERLKPRGAAAERMRLRLAATLAAVGIAVGVVAALALVPSGSAPLRVTGGAGSVAGAADLSGDTLTIATASGTARVPLGAGTATDRRGVAATQRTGSLRATGSGPASIDLDTLIADNGGRIPVGVDPARAPGPYDATWTTSTTVTAWTSSGRLIDVTTASTRVLTVSGGGLTSARTLTVGSPATAAATAASSATAVQAVQADEVVAVDRPLWAVQVPLALLLAGVLLVISTLVRRRRAQRGAAPIDLRTTGSPSYAAK